MYEHQNFNVNFEIANIFINNSIALPGQKRIYPTTYYGFR